MNAWIRTVLEMGKLIILIIMFWRSLLCVVLDDMDKQHILLFHVEDMLLQAGRKYKSVISTKI